MVPEETRSAVGLVLVRDLWAQITANMHSLEALMRWHSVNRGAYIRWSDEVYFSTLCKEAIEWNRRQYAATSYACHFKAYMHLTNAFAERALARLLIDNGVLPLLTDYYEDQFDSVEVKLLSYTLDPRDGDVCVAREMTIGKLLERSGLFSTSWIADQAETLRTNMRVVMRGVAAYVELTTGWIVVYEDLYDTTGNIEHYTRRKMRSIGSDSRIAFALAFEEEDEEESDDDDD